MLWEGRRQSSNIEDMRGSGGGGLAVGGGLGSLIIGLIIYLLGGNPNTVLNNNYSDEAAQQNPQAQQADDKTKQFIAVVLADTEDVWTKLFNDMNKQYIAPKLRLFTNQIQSGCGFSSAATGPFYCPADQRVYIDLSFFQEMKDRFQASSSTAPGDFAEAYVVAHEVGHHVQNLLGITEKVDASRGRLSEREQNALSVKVELQADFFAGVWAHYDEQMKNVLQPGDIDEALKAANAIGDDRLQQETQGRVEPDAFTHGTSEQRMYWFKKGYETGDISQGDTFNAPDLN